jgi:membrane protein
VRGASLNLLLAFRFAGRHFYQDDGFTQAGNLAYIGLFSLFPFLIVVVAAASLVGETDWGTRFAGQLLAQLPSNVASTLAGPMRQATSDYGKALTFGIVGTVWTAASGLEAARSALNRAYGVRAPKALWRRRLQSLGLIMVAAVATMMWMALLVVGPVVWSSVAPYFPPNPSLKHAWGVLRYLVSAGVSFAAVSTFYYILPNRWIAWRWALPGALLSVVLWLSAAALFSGYLSAFGAFTSMYGSLSGVVVVLLFFYVSGVIFIFGAEFNAAIAEIEDRSLRRG